MNANETVKIHPKLMTDINKHCASLTAHFKEDFQTIKYNIIRNPFSVEDILPPSLTKEENK